MEIQTMSRYIGKKVFLTLKNGFRYKFQLNEENIVEDTISFEGKFGEPIDILISDINFITVADERGDNKNG